MELKDFVTETLVQICKGIAEAQNEVPGYAVIAPLTGEEGFADGYSVTKEKPLVVHFDVEVSAVKSTEEGRGRGGFDISVADIRLAIQGGSPQNQKDDSRESSRVSFDVPILYPQGHYHYLRGKVFVSEEEQCSQYSSDEASS